MQIGRGALWAIATMLFAGIAKADEYTVAEGNASMMVALGCFWCAEQAFEQALAQMDAGHQEAMASGVLNILAENYEALVEVFKQMGVLDATKPDLRRPGTEEDFAVALRRCMGGAEGGGGDAGGLGSVGERRKLPPPPRPQKREWRTNSPPQAPK